MNNIITVKWNSETLEGRIGVESRELVRFDERGRLLLPDEWRWRIVSSSDHVLRRRKYGEAKSVQSKLSDENGCFEGIERRVLCENFVPIELADSGCSTEGNEPDLLSTDVDRAKEYIRLRGKMPVVEIIPSLVPGQEYHAYVWIESHDVPDDPEIVRRATPQDLVANRNELVRVIWNAGSYFSPAIVESSEGPKFPASFAYWGGFLIEAELHFADSYIAKAFVYAYLPSTK